MLNHRQTPDTAATTDKIAVRINSGSRMRMEDDRKYEEHGTEAERPSIRWSAQLERSNDKW